MHFFTQRDQCMAQYVDICQHGYMVPSSSSSELKIDIKSETPWSGMLNRSPRTRAVAREAIQS